MKAPPPVTDNKRKRNLNLAEPSTSRGVKQNTKDVPHLEPLVRVRDRASDCNSGQLREEIINAMLEDVKRELDLVISQEGSLRTLESVC